jgi:hypothetical protein
MKLLSKPKLTVYLLAIFVVGGITGALISEKLRKPDFSVMPPAKIAEHIHARTKQRLDPTPEQFKVIDPIIEKESHELADIHRETSEKILATIDKAHAEFAGVLTPEQRAIMEKTDAERRERFRKMMPPP